MGGRFICETMHLCVMMARPTLDLEDIQAHIVFIRPMTVCHPTPSHVPVSVVLAVPNASGCQHASREYSAHNEAEIGEWLKARMMTMASG